MSRLHDMKKRKIKMRSDEWIVKKCREDFEDAIAEAKIQSEIAGSY